MKLATANDFIYREKANSVYRVMKGIVCQCATELKYSSYFDIVYCDDFGVNWCILVNMDIFSKYTVNIFCQHDEHFRLVNYIMTKFNLEKKLLAELERCFCKGYIIYNHWAAKPHPSIIPMGR